MASLLLAAGALVLLVWHFYFLHYNRQQAIKLLNWLEDTLKGHATIRGLERITPAVYRADLQVRSALFQRAEVRVQLQPRHVPFAWLWQWWNKEPETLQFAADLHLPPGIELEVHNHRWRGPALGSRRRNLPSETRQAGPFVLTTRTDWEREITSMLTALVASRDCDFRSVRFSRRSPHFVAVIPTYALGPECSSASEIFTVMHELASCGSASKF